MQKLPPNDIQLLRIAQDAEPVLGLQCRLINLNQTLTSDDDAKTLMCFSDGDFLHLSFSQTMQMEWCADRLVCRKAFPTRNYTDPLPVWIEQFAEETLGAEPWASSPHIGILDYASSRCRR